jgi:tRNA threonylcarbamoyladenosine biosynthesis protein TsaB
MRILALDAATEACSAALLVQESVTERYEVLGRGHAARLLPMADELLREAGLDARELDAIAFGRGPGGFTGLRIAAGLAQGLAAGHRLPVVPVSNLAAVAAAAARSAGAASVLACMDARMGPGDGGASDGTGAAPVAVCPERLDAPEAVAPPGPAAWFGAGHGFAAHPGLATRLGAALAGVDSTILPRAADIARIAAVDLAAGRGLAAARGLPVYLRDDVVHRR